MSSLLLRRKKLLYRSWHRGCKEIDILLGSFAMNNIHLLTPNEVDLYEKIVNIDDHDLYLYITEKLPIPTTLDSILMNRIIDFNKLEVMQSE